jgi:hypothetical protein
LIKKNIQATLLDFPPQENMEAVGATIRLSNQGIIEVVSAYCPNENRCKYCRVVNDHAMRSGRYVDQPVVHPATSRI